MYCYRYCTVLWGGGMWMFSAEGRFRLSLIAEIHEACLSGRCYRKVTELKFVMTLPQKRLESCIRREADFVCKTDQ